MRGPRLGVDAHTLLLEQGLVAFAAVVPQRAEEPERDRRVVEPLQLAQLLLEGAVDSLGRRNEELRNEAAVGERERGDLALDGRRERAGLPHPRVLERMMLGLGQDMKAQDGLDDGRVGEGDRFGRVGREAVCDHRFTVWLKS